MTVPFNFATQSGNIPLSELDANFANVSASTLTATYVTGNNQSNITAVGTLNSLSAYGNVTAGNVSTNGIVRANAVIGVNYTGTNVSVTGNITGNNIIINGTLEFGNIAANGNVSGGNVLSSGLISAVGNIIGGNVETVNLVVNRISSDDSSYVTVEDGLEVHGNLISESLDVAGNTVMNNLTVTGNFVGTDIQVNSIVNGSSNVDITNPNGNVTIGVNGINNVMVVTSTGADVAGNISGYNLVINNIASDDSTAVSVLDDLSIHGDIDAIGDISATGNITGSYVFGNGSQLTGVVANSVGTLVSLSVTGNTTTGNLLTGGLISATGNIVTSGYFVGTFAGNISGNLIAPGSNTEVLFNDNGNVFAVPGFTYSTDSNTMTVLGVVSSQGNVSAGNVVTGGLISATGTVTGGNVVTGGVVSATGTVTGGNLVIPNGGKITGDFGASIAGGRTVFQTSTANGPTVLTSVPNGTNSTAALVAYNSSNTVNYASVAVIANATAISLRSANIGNAAPLPIVFETGNVARATIDVNGNVGIANVTPVDTLSVGGNAYVSGNVTAGGNVVTGGVVSATGTVTGGNVVTGGVVSATGTVTGGNVVTGGLISAAGDITGGNLVIPNGGKITGDFSSSVAAGRTVFQTSTANSFTVINAVPNGNGSIGAFSAYNTSDTTNPSFLTIQASASTVSLRSSRAGTGTYLPMLIETGGATRVTVDVNGNVGIANVTPVDTLSVGGNAYVSGKVTTLPTALANLTAVAGARAFINNANLVASGNFGTLVGSGGANTVPVWSDGSNWYIG